MESSRLKQKYFLIKFSEIFFNFFQSLFLPGIVIPCVCLLFIFLEWLVPNQFFYLITSLFSVDNLLQDTFSVTSREITNLVLIYIFLFGITKKIIEFFMYKIYNKKYTSTYFISYIHILILIHISYIVFICIFFNFWIIPLYLLSIISFLMYFLIEKLLFKIRNYESYFLSEY